METGFCRQDHEEEEVGRSCFPAAVWRLGGRELERGVPWPPPEPANPPTNGLEHAIWVSVMLGRSGVGSTLKALQLCLVFLLKGWFCLDPWRGLKTGE